MAVFSFSMWIISFEVSIAMLAVFATLWPGYVLLGLARRSTARCCSTSAAHSKSPPPPCAWYASFVITANKTTDRDGFPVGETRSAQQDASG